MSHSLLKVLHLQGNITTAKLCYTNVIVIARGFCMINKENLKIQYQRWGIWLHSGTDDISQIEADLKDCFNFEYKGCRFELMNADSVLYDALNENFMYVISTTECRYRITYKAAICEKTFEGFWFEPWELDKIVDKLKKSAYVEVKPTIGRRIL